MNICKAENCNRESYRQGYCSLHVYRFRRYGDPNITKYITNNKCVIEGCNDKYCAGGYCAKHYQRFKKYGDPMKRYIPEIKICQVNGCTGIYDARGYCRNHYNQLIRSKKPKCLIEDCQEITVSQGYCNKHYLRLRIHGDANKTIRDVNPHDKCSIEGCNKKFIAKGMCNAHYMSWYNDKRRAIVINHYTKGENKCQCCGESILILLTIEHDNQDGAKHRHEGIHSGSDLINWLIRNNFPEGFSVLCSTCNVGKYRNGGICPHKDPKYNP
ncbi:MAG: hypothetical protein KGI05_09085 [Thaumarchaeota archaeon]|nr:hypothetical protein [Nitrososphaerota archaeon]